MLSTFKKQPTHGGFTQAFIVASRRGKYEHDDHRPTRRSNAPLRQSMGRTSLIGNPRHQRGQPLAQASGSECVGAALARIIETANGHRAKGLPKGSPAYFVLRDKADAKIQVFARKWGVDIATIKAQAPALADLDSLCVPDTQIPAGLKLLAALLGTILSLVLLGAASGLVHAGHDWVMRFVGR